MTWRPSSAGSSVTRGVRPPSQVKSTGPRRRPPGMGSGGWGVWKRKDTAAGSARSKASTSRRAASARWTMAVRWQDRASPAGQAWVSSTDRVSRSGRGLKSASQARSGASSWGLPPMRGRLGRPSGSTRMGSPSQNSITPPALARRPPVCRAQVMPLNRQTITRLRGVAPVRMRGGLRRSASRASRQPRSISRPVTVAEGRGRARCRLAPRAVSASSLAARPTRKSSAPDSSGSIPAPAGSQNHSPSSQGKSSWSSQSGVGYSGVRSSRSRVSRFISAARSVTAPVWARASSRASAASARWLTHWSISRSACLRMEDRRCSLVSSRMAASSMSHSIASGRRPRPRMKG